MVVTGYRSQNLQDGLKTLIIYEYKQFPSKIDNKKHRGAEDTERKWKEAIASNIRLK